MFKSRLLASLIAASLLAAGCSQDSGQPGASASSDGDLLAYVPADTPYVFGNLEPTPEEVTEFFLTRMQPALDLVQEKLSTYLPTLQEEGSDEAKLVTAILSELDGNLSRSGIESMGFSLNSHQVVYGMGAFPMARMGLGDSEAFLATLDRIQSNSGATFPKYESNGHDYWRFTDEEGKVGIYAAVVGNHLALGIFPTGAEAEILPSLLGDSTPADTLDTNSILASLNSEYDFTPYGSGFVDVMKLVDELMQANSTTRGLLEVAGLGPETDIDAVCVDETRQMVSHFPRLVVGYSEMSTQAMDTRFVLETDSNTAGALQALTSGSPMVGENSGGLFSMALGLKVTAIRDYLLEKATAIVDTPYQCGHFAQLNNSANDMIEQLNRPMPPFINNLQGFRLALNDLDMQNNMPVSGDGLFALYVDQPQMLIGMGQMMVPPLAELDITPGGDPVAIPSEMIPMPGLTTYVAASDNAIGLAVGDSQVAGLTSFLDSDGDSDGAFFSVEYDMSAYMEYFQKPYYESIFNQAKDDYQARGGDDMTGANDAMEIMKTFSDAYQDIMDRNHMVMSFTDKGIEGSSKSTFK